MSISIECFFFWIWSNTTSVWSGYRDENPTKVLPTLQLCHILDHHQTSNMSKSGTYLQFVELTSGWRFWLLRSDCETFSKPRYYRNLSIIISWWQNQAICEKAQANKTDELYILSHLFIKFQSNFQSKQQIGEPRMFACVNKIIIVSKHLSFSSPFSFGVYPIFRLAKEINVTFVVLKV